MIQLTMCRNAAESQSVIVSSPLTFPREMSYHRF
jgi:hypothetical protein